MGEVQRSCSCVAVDPCDGPVMALKHLTNARFAVEHTDEEGGRQLSANTLTDNTERDKFHFLKQQMLSNDLRL